MLCKHLPTLIRDLFILYYVVILDEDNIKHNDITPRNISVPLKYAVFDQNTDILQMLCDSKIIDFECEDFILTEKDYQLASPADCDLHYREVVEQRENIEQGSQTLLFLKKMDGSR